MLDGKLHVVAAPGSGKTTLGLEIFRRLGKPALVLSPTRTIRDQWVLRLKDFTTDVDVWPPVWTSTDLRHPAMFTSVTYQALHSQYRESENANSNASNNSNGDNDSGRDRVSVSNNDNDNDGGGDNVNDSEEAETVNAKLDTAPNSTEIAQFRELLTRANIGTLLLDEAHHLRAEWWKALIAVTKDLPSLKIVSLTATPPYDALGTEWNRYQELCGPIDEEISVPELVRAGTLCPHQDYVWTVVPMSSERKFVEQYDRDVAKVCATLLADAGFEVAVDKHPWLTAETLDEVGLLDRSELAIALLVYLKVKRKPLPERIMTLLDLRESEVPPISRDWWQKLVKAYLFDQQWLLDDAQQQHRKLLTDQLRSQNLLWRKELRLNESRLAKSYLTLSSAKIKACVDIHRAEREKRGASLRQVILTDFIRDQDMSKGKDANKDTNKDTSASINADDKPVVAHAPLGAWPVFRALVEATNHDGAKDMALLTGRLVIVHHELLPALQALMQGETLVSKPMESMPEFHRVMAQSQHSVSAVTALLTSGSLRTVVGTRALLGEGWDAPVVNSLVLASFVGSFMLTNQMRGRAIRVNARDTDKASSIWHVVAVIPESQTGYADVTELNLRFRTFVGLSEGDNAIESGLQRMALLHLREHGMLSKEIVGDFLSLSKNFNSVVLKRLEKIDELGARWRRAIEKGEVGHIAPTVVVQKPPSVAPIWFSKTLKYLFLQVILAALMLLPILVSSVSMRSDRTLIVLLAVGVLGTLYTAPKLVIMLWLWIRHLPVDGTVQQIALAVRDTLCQTGLILGGPAQFKVVTIPNPDGSVSIAMTGGTFFERSLFSTCVNEILGPIDNPRYLLTRGNVSQQSRRGDFHAVPQCIGVKKVYAEVLAEVWRRRVGPTELIHLRGPEGRRDLLKARSRSFSSAMEKAVERLDRWY